MNDEQSKAMVAIVVSLLQGAADQVAKEPDAGDELTTALAKFAHKQVNALAKRGAFGQAEAQRMNATYRRSELDSLPPCPACGNKLVKRPNKWGDEFVGCSGYGKMVNCHHTGTIIDG